MNAVYQIKSCTGSRYFKDEWREVSYTEFEAAQGMPYIATRILYPSMPSEPLRDEIAIKAMERICGGLQEIELDRVPNAIAWIGRTSYAIADAMLAAREKTP